MLVVRGPNVTSGYLNDDEQTRQAFTADGFLKSGDLAYLDHGYIFILGRIDDVFNSGGEKIAPLEIERALNECPGVALSAVTSAQDPQRGAVPVAFVKTTGDVSRAEIVTFLSERLTRNKLPQRYLRVTDFPMTANGKLQRNRLSADDYRFVIGELR
jgi:O-succinylbenzoic acid--CoA ligase